MTSFRFLAAGSAAAALLVLAAACSSSEDPAANPIDADASPDAPPSRGDARSDDSSSDPDAAADAGPVPSTAAADVCPDAAKKICAFLSTCAPEIVTGAWESAAECEPRFRDNCLAAYPTNAEVRKDDADAYASCLGKLTCDNLNGLAAYWSIACTTPRLATTKALGEPCRSGFECETGACSGSSTACGKCVQRKKAGDACTEHGECPVGGLCGTKCYAPAYVGQLCDDVHFCVTGTSCVAGKCEKSGAAGADCDSDSDCDLTALVECNKTSGKCEKETFADPGDPCPAAFDPGPPVLCTKGSSCIRPAMEAGTCVTNAKVGEACGATTKRCEAFINCRDDVCVLPTYESCP